MNTLRFSIMIKAIDCYIYSGHFFFVIEDGTLVFTPVSRIISKLSLAYPNHKNLLRLAFQRNDFFANNQGELIFGIDEITSSFSKIWEEVSETIDFQIEIDDEDIKVIDEVPSMPVLDMRLYGMKMFVGSKEGLYQTNLDSDDRYNFKPSRLKKIFDSKVTCLNAKSGTIVISSNNDGLFHGNIFHSSGYTKVFEKPVANKSLRTGWAVLDIINYEEQNSFNYYVNRVEKIETIKEFSKFDDRRERHAISEFGISKYGVAELLRTSEIRPENINYCFNSSSSGFFILKDGRFVNSNIRIEKTKAYAEASETASKEIHFSSKLQTLPTISSNSNTFRKPISSSIVPNGCIIEYFDNVVLYRDNDSTIIEFVPAINVRTFPMSIRYRNIICVTKPNEVTIHAMYPF